MTVHLDVSEVRGLAARITTNSGRLGARASAAFRKTAFDIEADAQALAPVDTGTLESSISTSITGDGRTGAMTAEIGPTVDYGIHQEYGTSTQAGTPYMGPAFDRRAPGLNHALAQILTEVV